MKIYISGKITGLPEWRDYFSAVERHIKKTIPGAKAVNPARIGDALERSGDRMPSYGDYMRRDLRALVECDAIYIMPNWRTSAGAKLEKAVAEACGIFPVWITAAEMRKMLAEYRAEKKRKGSQ